MGQKLYGEMKLYEKLSFSDHFMFCRVLRKDTELCKEILELILERKFKYIRYPENQKTIEITSDEQRPEA